MKVVLWKGFAFSEEEEGRRRGVIVVVTTRSDHATIKKTLT